MSVERDQQIAEPGPVGYLTDDRTLTWRFDQNE